MTLLEAFSNIEDTREFSGRRYTLVSIFTMLLAGLLSGNNSLTRISKWFRSLPKKSAEDLGFMNGRPCIATLSNILRRIPIESVEKILGKRYSDKIPNKQIAIDGKSLRGVALPKQWQLFGTRLSP